MKKAILVVFALAVVSLGLRLTGVLPASSLVPALLLGLAMILMLLNVVAETDRKY